MSPEDAHRNFTKPLYTIRVRTKKLADGRECQEAVAEVHLLTHDANGKPHISRTVNYRGFGPDIRGTHGGVPVHPEEAPCFQNVKVGPRHINDMKYIKPEVADAANRNSR